MNLMNFIDTWANMDMSANINPDASYNRIVTTNIRNYIDHLLNLNNNNSIINGTESLPDDYNLNNIIQTPYSTPSTSAPTSNTTPVSMFSSTSTSAPPSTSNFVDNAYGNFLENMLLGTNNVLNSSNYHDNRIRRLLAETLSQTNNYKKVLSEEGKESVKNEKYSSEKYKDQKCCPISQKNFTEGDYVSVLPCNHIFNPELIKKWLENENATCPVCRFKLKSKEIKMDSSSVLLESPPPSSSAPIPIHRTRRRYDTGGEYLRRSMHRLLLERERQQEENDIQEALLASLETNNVDGDDVNNVD
jgi:hypothetical protein